MHKYLVSAATALVLGSAASSAFATCPATTAPPHFCDTGTVHFVAANEAGYKIRMSPSGNFFALQYMVGPGDPAAVGFVASLADGAVRTVITDGSKLSLGDGKFFNIIVVRNWDE